MNKRNGMENLHPPFEPGQSGNPDGRPKGAKDGLKARVRAYLRKKPDAQLGEVLQEFGIDIEDRTNADVLADLFVRRALMDLAQGKGTWINGVKLLLEYAGQDEDEAERQGQGNIYLTDPEEAARFLDEFLPGGYRRQRMELEHVESED